MRNATSLSKFKLNRVELPPYAEYLQACNKGLSVVYPFKSGSFPDLHGWKYEQRNAPSYAAFGRMRALLAVKDAFDCKPKRVLEVATGGGGLSATLAKGGCDVTANDLRETHAIEAMQEFVTGASIKVVGGDMFKLSAVQLGEFDLVIACEVIEHVAHPRDLLNHLKGFLAPNGKLLLTTPNGSYFRNKLPTHSEIIDESELESKQFKPDADGHLFLLTPEELSALSASAGLRVERLGVWGTPLLSGHCGFRYTACKAMTKFSFYAESLTQQMPSIYRERLCTQLSAILAIA